MTFHPKRETRPRNRKTPRTHCLDCGVKLTDENGYRRHDSSTFRVRCRTCDGAMRRQRHDEREDAMRAEFGRDLCDICGEVEVWTRSGQVRRPTKDHDHAADEWRGLLCSRCNTGIGMFRDSPRLLRAAATYLEAPPGLPITRRPSEVVPPRR